MATGARNASQRFEERLVLRARLDSAALERAHQRQRIYGGALDTALLELGLVDEATVRTVLEEETRLDPLPRALLNGPVVAPTLLLDSTSSRRAGTIAYALDTLAADGMSPATRVQAIVRLGFDVGTLARAIGNAQAQVFIVPEVRFEALWGAFYEQPISERFLALLGRLLGAAPARQWAAPGGHKRARVPSPTVDVGPRLGAPQSVILEAPPNQAPGPALVFEPVPGPVPEPEPVPGPVPEPEPVPGPVPEPEPVPVPGPVAPLSAAELARLRDHYLDLQGSPHAFAIARELLARTPVTTLLDELPALVAGPPAEPDDGPRARAWLSIFSATPLAPETRADARVLLTRRLTHPEARWRTWAALAFAAFPTEALDPASVERLCIAYNAERETTVGTACLRALRGHLDHPAVSALRTALSIRLSEGNANDAQQALAELVLLRDPAAIPLLIELLRPGRTERGRLDKAAVHAALVTLTAHDLGTRPGPWRRWWKSAASQERSAWLVEALASRAPRLRLAAIEELVALTGQRLGYYFDLPPAARKQAIARWRDWREARSASYVVNNAS